MPEQDLDGPDVGAGLEQVGGEAVPQRVDGDVLAQARGRARPARRPVCTVRGGERPARDVAGEEPIGPGRAAFQ